MTNTSSCVHIENLKINYEAIDIQLYDNADLTVPSCKKCSNQDNNLISLNTGDIICKDCLVNSNSNEFMKLFNGEDDNTLWCNNCNKFINQKESIISIENQKKLKNINDLFKVMKLFIYYDKRNLKNLDKVDKSIKELILENSRKIINENIETSGGGGGGGEEEEEEEEEELNKFINLINLGKCKNIIVLTGAGISVASGIPDFRSVETGLYNNSNVSKFKLPFKEAVFDIDYFKFNPEPFYILAKDLYPGKFKTTAVHHFIKLLSDKGLLLRNYAQNADTLERIAGVPLDKLIEAHGSFATSKCVNCLKDYSQDYIKSFIFNSNNSDDTSKVVPRCENIECNGSIIKPDIVFFGEALPTFFNECILQDINKCDALIVIGTSLKVQPIASMINFFTNVPRLLINNQIVGENNYGGFQFSNNNNNNNNDSLDFKMIGDCQESVLKLSKLLNWENDLLNLIKNQKYND